VERWLRYQILRCAVSVPANIAEGHGRGSKAELLRFIDITRGSLSELEYYLHFLMREELRAPGKLLALDAKRIETGKVLFGLWRSLKGMPSSKWDHTGIGFARRRQST
jgi:four helix bundle protein